MKKTQIKDALRNIKKQYVSFLSIIVIAVLGVAAFLGIVYGVGAIRNIGSDYYNRVNFRDIEAVSTLLFEKEDLEKIRQTEGVADAEAIWTANVKAVSGEERRDACAVSMTERINLPDVVEGSLPSDKTECAVEQYLTDLNRDTQETYDMMIRQYAEIEGVTEDLKRSDAMEYTRRMNSIRNRVEEFVLHDFVYA